MSLSATRLALSHVGAPRRIKTRFCCMLPPASPSPALARSPCAPVSSSAPSARLFNAVTFQRFLAQLLRHRRQGRRIILVLDNARYHHAVILAPFLHQHTAHLKLLFLPPYSPQLAPIERVWKLTRRLAMHNRYFPTLGEVLKAVHACFNRWRHPNAILRRLCCII